MSTLLLIAIGSLLLFITFVVRPVAASMARNKQKHNHCVSKFLEATPALISDERIPAPLAELLFAVSTKIDEPGFVIPLAGAIMDKNTRRARPISQEMDAMDAELRMEFNQTLAYGLLSISYSSYLFGWILRSVWLKPVGMPERSTDAPYFASRAFAHCH
jgi:hypothetical protein